MTENELVQREGEPLKEFVERVVRKWEEAGMIEVDGEVMATLEEDDNDYPKQDRTRFP